MRLSRSDAEQNRRATSICKAYAKRGLALQVASDQCFIGRCEIFDFANVPRMGFCCSVLGRIAPSAQNAGRFFRRRNSILEFVRVAHTKACAAFWKAFAFLVTASILI